MHAGEARAGVASLTRQTFESLVDLIGAQIRLAKVEATGDVRSFVTKVAKLLTFAPLLGLGYAFANAAAAVMLARWVGLAGGLAIVGGGNLLIGGVGCYLAIAALRGVGTLSHTRANVAKTLDQVEAIAEGG